MEEKVEQSPCNSQNYDDMSENHSCVQGCVYYLLLTMSLYDLGFCDYYYTMQMKMLRHGELEKIARDKWQKWNSSIALFDFKHNEP